MAGPNGDGERRLRRRAGALVAASLLMLGVTACGSDSADDAKDPSNSTSTSTSTSTSVTAGETGEFAVIAKDYEFVDLPATVKVGTKLSLENQSQKELHELVAIKMPESESRPIAELLKLTEAELDALLGAAEPAMVLIHPPGGGEMIAAVGDGTFKEPGRYAVLCAIPVGVDPDAYMAAAQEATDGPPQVEGADGPPHFTQGMYGEVTVVA